MTWELPSFVTIGRGTYWPGDVRWQHYRDDELVTIGNYCSIAKMASFVPGGSHRSDLVSTFPFDSDRTYSHGDSITVGNDVYICEFAYIGGRASIGNGAIVGANAVVFNSVPAYSIVVGNPAKIVRFRFSVDTISALQNIAWWNWPHNKIMERIEWFYGPVEEFIREFKN